MALYVFGSGTLWGCRTDITNPTPVKFGTLQDCSVEISATQKEMRGQGIFPEAIGRSEGKIQCKAKMGRIQGAVFYDLFFGVTPTTSQNTTANAEPATVPAGGGSVTVSNGAAFSGDLGVVYGSTGQANAGLPMKRVASAPAAGQYSVNTTTGAYTFAAADAGAALLISYTYNIPAAGQSMLVTNQAQGQQPVFSVTLETTFNASNGQKKGAMVLYACTASKLSFGTKHGDFAIPEFDFQAMADANGNVFQMSTSEAS